MKVEAWIFGGLVIFFGIVTPVYWFMSHEITGTTALTLTFLLVLMIGGYLALISRRIPPRPEDRREGEIVEGAGELGFFPPHSKWPLFCALTLGLFLLGPVFGWWMSIVAVGIGVATLTGWIYEFYRGDYEH